MILIASFPHSGNHLVRFLVEYLTGRPTLGCLENPKDRPLHEAPFPPQPDVLGHVAGEAVALKLHYEHEIKRAMREYDIRGVVFVERSPIEAVLSYFASEKAARRSPDLRKFAKRYFLLRRWMMKTNFPVVRLSYEDLIATERSRYEPQIIRLAAAFPSIDDGRLATLMSDFDTLRSICRWGKGHAYWDKVRSSGERFWADHTPILQRLTTQFWVGIYSMGTFIHRWI